MVAPDPGAVVTGARDEVLARVRSALGPDRTEPDVPREYRRSGEHAAGSPALLALLRDRLVDYRATVHTATPTTVIDVLQSVLRDVGRIVVPPGLPHGWAPAGAVADDGSLGAAELDAFDTVLTACRAAAAETGTIVLDAAADQGRRAITLVPDRHVCVVRADQVVQTVPELLTLLDPRRPLTFISGPSATSDIELQRVEGVHGPRTLIVVLVSAASESPARSQTSG